MGPLPRLEEVGRILSWCSAFCEKGLLSAGCWWLMTVILDTQELQIRQIISSHPIWKKRSNGVAQGEKL